MTYQTFTFLCLFCCVSISGATATQFPHFGPGAGLIVLEDVKCNGNEANLTQCRHNRFGFHDCVHRSGVFCSNGKSVYWMICTLITISQSMHMVEILLATCFIASTEKWTVVATLFSLQGVSRGALLMLKLHFLMPHRL